MITLIVRSLNRKTAPARRSDGGVVVSETLASETQLQTLKRAFGEKCRRLLAEFVDRRQP